MPFTPGQDALTVEVVPLIAGQGGHLLALLEVLHADDTLLVGVEEVRIVVALVQCERLFWRVDRLIGNVFSFAAEQSLGFLSSLSTALRAPDQPHDQPDCK